MSALDDMKRALLVQGDQLQKGEGRVGALRNALDRARATQDALGDGLDELEARTAALLAQVGLEEGEIEKADPALTRFDPSAEQLAQIDLSLPTFDALRTVDLDAADFQTALETYAHAEGVDLDADPIRALLSPEAIASVQSTWQRGIARIPWDGWDYALVGGAAVLGTLVDVTLALVPPGSVWKGKRYDGSPITKFLREKSATAIEGDGLFARLQRAAERWAKVPYDISRNDRERGVDVDGLRPAMHRIMSPGHDPVLGFIFGVLDQMRGQCTLVDRFGVTHVIANGSGVSLPLAIAKQIAHLFSDLPTSMGLPPPFFTALQWITAKTPISVGSSGEPQSVADVTRWMYGQGYDARHFATMSIVPTVVETIVRVGFFARHHEQLRAEGPTPPNLALKRDEMLLAAHAVTASANALKVVLMQGNPLAINQAVWMAAAASTLRMLRTRAQHDTLVQRELLKGWQSIAPV